MIDLGDFKGKVILVTGGAGFIGHHLVKYIISFNPEKLIVVDDMSTGVKENLRHLIDTQKISFIEANVEELSASLLPPQIDFIFHFAAIVSVPFSMQQPFRSHSVNESSLLNILEIAKHAKVKKVIFASSSAVYGEPVEVPISEGQRLNPKSPYAYSKYINELHAKSFAETLGVDFLAFRFFNVFGAGQKADSPYSGVITLFMNKVKNDNDISIYGNGSQSRDFVYVQDVVNALVLGALSVHKNKVYNVGTGKATTINELHTIIQKIFGTAKQATYKAERAGDIKESVANIQKIQDELNFVPQVSLEKGLRILASSEFNNI